MDLASGEFYLSPLPGPHHRLEPQPSMSDVSVSAQPQIACDHMLCKPSGIFLARHPTSLKRSTQVLEQHPCDISKNSPIASFGKERSDISNSLHSQEASRTDCSRPLSPPKKVVWRGFITHGLDKTGIDARHPGPQVRYQINNSPCQSSGQCCTRKDLRAWSLLIV